MPMAALCASSSLVSIAKNSKPNISILRTPQFILHPSSPTPRFCSLKILRATALQKNYKYPDPIPEFAQAETQKFKTELLRQLSMEEAFEDELDKVIEVCAEILNEFLQKEYGGPGTLLVEPFTDMLVALKERKLPGAPLAARASLLWAQNYVDQDWEVWSSKQPQ